MEAGPGLIVMVAFAIGAVPFGWIIARLWGVPDLRAVGSANVGATNVVRAAGWLPGALTFVLDFLKGLLPLLLFECGADSCGVNNIGIGVAAVLGHCYSPFLKFRGGKGVSTTLGMMMALDPILGGACILTYLLGLGVLRVSALGSLFAMLVAVTGELVFGQSTSEKLGVVFVVLVVLCRHRTNWEQLLKSTSGTLVALLVVGLGVQPLSPVHAEQAAVVTDFRGRPAASARAPDRIAALMPNLAEAVVDLGAGGRLIAAPEYSRLPEPLRSRVKILGPYNSLSAELIYSLKPDLVLASMDGNDSSVVERLEKLGARVVTTNTQSMADILRSMRIVAEAIGEAGSEKVAELERVLSPTPGIGAGSAGRARPRVFVQIGWDPLITISGKTFMDEMVRLAGGVNVFAGAAMKYPRPNAEEVIRQNPDVLIICNLTDSGAEATRAKAFWMRFKKMNAVRAGRLHVIPGDWLAKPGFSLLRGMEELRKIL